MTKIVNQDKVGRVWFSLVVPCNIKIHHNLFDPDPLTRARLVTRTQAADPRVFVDKIACMLTLNRLCQSHTDVDEVVNRSAVNLPDQDKKDNHMNVSFFPMCFFFVIFFLLLLFASTFRSNKTISTHMNQSDRARHTHWELTLHEKPWPHLFYIHLTNDFCCVRRPNNDVFCWCHMSWTTNTSITFVFGGCGRPIFFPHIYSNLCERHTVNSKRARYSHCSFFFCFVRFSPSFFCRIRKKGAYEIPAEQTAIERTNGKPTDTSGKKEITEHFAGDHI